MFRSAFVSLAVLAFALASVVLGACSDHRSTSRANGDIGTVGGGSRGTGTIGMHLTVPPGVDILDFHYVIHGPNTYAGTVHVGDAQSVEFVVGGVLAGRGYTVTLSATDSNGDPCSGTSEPFDVAAGATTSASVIVQCVQTGTVGIQLTVSGVTIHDIDFVINGPNTFTGTVHIGEAQSIEFTVGGLPAGDGYTITLTGTDANGVVCSGTSAMFNIVSGETSQVIVLMVCNEPNDASSAADVTTGALSVDAGIVIVIVDAGGSFQCPGIALFSVSPAEALVGQPVTLELGTVGPAPSITWTATPASGGTFSPNNTAAQTTFTCAAGGDVSVSVTVDLPGGGCGGLPFTTMSGVVRCESPD